MNKYYWNWSVEGFISGPVPLLFLNWQMRLNNTGIGNVPADVPQCAFYHTCSQLRIILFNMIWSWRWVLPIMTYTGRLRPKGVPFKAFHIHRGPNFISWGIWKGREIGDFRVYKAQKGQQMHLTAVKKSRERSAFVTYSYITHSALTALKRDAKI